MWTIEEFKEKFDVAEIKKIAQYLEIPNRSTLKTEDNYARAILKTMAENKIENETIENMLSGENNSTEIKTENKEVLEFQEKEVPVPEKGEIEIEIQAGVRVNGKRTEKPTKKIINVKEYNGYKHVSKILKVIG